MNNMDAQKALERSYVSSLENKEYDEAVKLAETLCLLDPNNPEYSHKIAYVYLQQLKWEEAIEAELKTLKLDAQYIPALDLAVTTSARFKDKKEIDLNTCIDEDKLKKYIDDVKIDKDLVDYLMNNAISNLKRAKFNHDIVEDYYVPAMDFNKVELLKDEIINRILKYKK